MAVEKSEGIKYNNAVNYHYSNCLNSCLEQGYVTIMTVPGDATPAQTEAITMWNSNVSKK